MTTDHRLIPGIEFVSCPGPLRVGDYFINRSALYGGPPIFIVSPLTEPSDRHDDRRVIPVVRLLEVPEETTIASLDELEVCTVKSEFSEIVWLTSAGMRVAHDGLVLADVMADEEQSPDLAADINLAVAFSRGAE